MEKRSEVSQFLKKIFGLSLLHPAEVCDCLRWNFYPIFWTTSEWNSFATAGWKILLKETPLFRRLFDSNVLYHHWGPSTHVSHSIPTSVHYFTVRIIKFLFLFLHCKKHRMRPISKWESSLQGLLKKTAKFKKGDLVFSNIAQYKANVTSRTEFVSSGSYKFPPNPNLYFIIAWI